jgi:hypothetical protein
MIVSIVSEGQNVGHAGLMFERLKRLHETMRARGASEAAIARLPKLPSMAIKVGLPPVVLATAKIGAHPKQKAGAQIMLANAKRIGGRFVDTEARAVERAKGRQDRATQEDIERVKLVREIAAAVYGARSTIARVRRHAVAIAREITGLSYPRLSPLFGVDDPQQLWRDYKALSAIIATDLVTQGWDRQIREALPAHYFEVAP